MGIVEIAVASGQIDPVRDKKPGDKARVQQRVSKDRVELSDEAKSLYGADQTRKTDAIREKVNSGFYFQPEVTEKVVDALLKDLQQGKGA